MRHSIVMLDLDGTLTDTKEDLSEAILQRAVEETGAPENETREVVRTLVGLPPTELYSGLLRLLGRDPGRMLESDVLSLRSWMNGVTLSLTRLFPEVKEVLPLLVSSGYKLILTTNTPAGVVGQRIDRAGLTEYFELLLGVDHLGGVSKSDHPRLAREYMGLSGPGFAELAVLVGDSAGDMHVAREAGLTAIGRLTGDNGQALLDAGAHHVIRDLRELEPLLRGLDEVPRLDPHAEDPGRPE